MRDEKGEEMHKSKGNAIWFEDAADKMGVDSMRWQYTRHNPAANLNFGYGTVDEVRRRFIIPLWNVYSFFVTYANIDEYNPLTTPAPAVSDRPELDRWIISELNLLVAEVKDALDNFEPDRSARAAESFVEYLSNWYVRRSRRRFWKSGVVSANGEADHDKLCAYSTLYECLVTLTKLLAPMMPFLTESMYQNLVRSPAESVQLVEADLSRYKYRDPDASGKPVPAKHDSKVYESVHLDMYPESDISLVDQRLSDATRLAMRLSSMGRAARSKSGLKVRQPLEKVLVKVRTPEEAELLAQITPQVQDELNVKSVAALADEALVMEFAIQPNMPLLGPKYGSELPKIRSAIAQADPLQVFYSVSSGRNIQLNGFDLEPGEVIVNNSDKDGYAVSSEAGYTVAVTTEVTPELELEGMARELVHRIQNMRRSADFDIADYIVTYYRGNAELDRVIDAHAEYIKQETLTRELVNAAPPVDAWTETHSFDGLEATIGVRRE
jgi:isoleucyl-tRNA synthetase